MNTFNKKPLLFLLVAALFASLSSFAPAFGGEGYRITVNGKLVLESYGADVTKAKTLQLDQYPNGAELKVYYYHCGKLGKNRVITIRNDKNTVLKQWKYRDVNDVNSEMTCGVSDIISLQKGSENLYLYYNSTELPTERLLVSIQTNATAKAIRK